MPANPPLHARPADSPTHRILTVGLVSPTTAATLSLTSNETSRLTTLAEYVVTVREGYGQRSEGASARPWTKLFNRKPPDMLATYATVLPETDAMSGCMCSVDFGVKGT